MWGEQQTLCGSMELGAGRLLQTAKHEACLHREEGAWALSGDTLAGSPSVAAQMQCHAIGPTWQKAHGAHVSLRWECLWLPSMAIHTTVPLIGGRGVTPQGCC